jgi:hypothetical protein
MLGGIWGVILGLVSGLVSVFGKVLEHIKTQELIDQGKSLQQAEIAKEEIDKSRAQTEILSQDRTREETIEKLERGDF